MGGGGGDMRDGRRWRRHEGGRRWRRHGERQIKESRRALTEKK